MSKMNKYFIKKIFELIEKIKKNCIRRQFITYFFVAVFAYIVDYIMFLFTMYLSSNLVTSNIVAKLATSITGYILHSKYTYRVKLFSSLKTFVMYFGTVAIYTPIATGFLLFFDNFFHHNVAKLISDIMLFIGIYFFTSIFIFNKKRS
jgi:putative flippase GtrA